MPARRESPFPYSPERALEVAEESILRAKKEEAQFLSLGPSLPYVPSSLRSLTHLARLYLHNNRLSDVPDWIHELPNLNTLYLHNNELPFVPDSLRKLTHIKQLYLNNNSLRTIPEWIEELSDLEILFLHDNSLTDLPSSLCQLTNLKQLTLYGNPFGPELAAARSHGLDAVTSYLRAKSESSVVINEAKLIIIGEGGVGKSCLLDALRDDPWTERDSTHGIRLATVSTVDDAGTSLTLNAWDFGGQPVYRPTHQLFFSSPAIYIVAWKPRDGYEAGQVREWIKLIKHRAADAKVFVVSTHGGPNRRQPDIQKHELQKEFGSDTLLGFMQVDSRPTPDIADADNTRTGERRGIAALRSAIANEAMKLPEMGQSVPAKWQRAREQLSALSRSWMPWEEFTAFCIDNGLPKDQVSLFAKLHHTLGHIIHYSYDPVLRDIVILKPDWLAKAISFALDDEQTRANNGLVSISRLNTLWNSPKRQEEDRYPTELHAAFLRLLTPARRRACHRSESRAVLK